MLVTSGTTMMIPRLFIYYDSDKDGSGDQWIEIGAGPTGAQGTQGTQGLQGHQGLQGLQVQGNSRTSRSPR